MINNSVYVFPNLKCYHKLQEQRFPTPNNTIWALQKHQLSNVQVPKYPEQALYGLMAALPTIKAGFYLWTVEKKHTWVLRLDRENKYIVNTIK